MITELINNPHLLDKQTLYELRELVAQYPYYHPARLMLLKNLYLLHDTSFDEELRRAAFFLPDRQKLFELVEGKNFVLTTEQRTDEDALPATADSQPDNGSRTASLIDQFLNQIPEEEPVSKKQKPLPWYANNDYMQLLVDTAETPLPPLGEGKKHSRQDTLIDDFLSQGGKMSLAEMTAEEEKAIVDAIQLSTKEDDYIDIPTQEPIKKKTYENPTLSEELAQKYIKQGNYLRAKEIITQLNLDNSEKIPYFADQIRFLEKLIRLTATSTDEATDKPTANGQSLENGAIAGEKNTEN